MLYFREHDRPLVDVIVPEQDVSTGTVQMLAMEFAAGWITVEGNEWFDDGLLQPALRVRPGETVSGSRLLEDVNWLNENPFRHSDLVYQRGRNPGETDIILRTQDRFPVRVFSGVENTGNATTSRNRMFTGFNWGNAFRQDHRLSYQYTVSPDAALHPGSGRYLAHSLTYQVPLPWRDTLTVFGSYSRSQPKLPDLFRQTGVSGQASARYTLRLPKLESYNHSIDLGFDFKRTNNDLDFGGTNISSGLTDVLQGVLGYAGMATDDWGKTSLSANVFLSPGGLTGHNTDGAFQPSDTSSGRTNAQARYAYLRLALERETPLPLEFSWVAGLAREKWRAFRPSL